MARASDWFADVASVIEDAKTLREALALRPRHPLGGDHWALPGLPGVVPLWADGDWTFGLMIVPDHAVETWPGVMVWRAEAVTLATDAATLLPRFLVARHLSNFPDDANALKGNWGKIERQLYDLHAALGGDAAALEAVAAVVLADARRARFVASAGPRQDFEAAHEALFRAIDRSPAFAAFADWFAAQLRGARMPPSPSNYGNWGRQALAWSVQLDLANGGLPRDLPALAPLVTGHSGWDTAVSAAPRWFDPASGGSLGLAAMAAQLIQTGPTLDDPIDRRLVRSAADAGSNYDGIAHAEAVPALAAQGESLRAWGALCAAAWWMQTNRGETPSAIANGARLLATSNGWDDLSWVVEQGGAR